MAGLPYEGTASHLRLILQDLGYDDATIERLARDKIIALGRRDAAARERLNV